MQRSQSQLLVLTEKIGSSCASPPEKAGFSRVRISMLEMKLLSVSHECAGLGSVPGSMDD